MPDDNINPDQLLSEPPEYPPQLEHERKGSMSLSLKAAPNANGDDVSKDDSAPAPAPTDPNAKAVHDVVNSEIGVATLLNRLKQSIASAKVGSPGASTSCRS
jgi:hypothetical protein